MDLSRWGLSTVENSEMAGKNGAFQRTGSPNIQQITAKSRLN
jgi:hypothetical protein